MATVTMNGYSDKAGGGGAPPLPKLKKNTSEQTIHLPVVVVGPKSPISGHREIDDLIAERRPSRVSSGSGPQMTVRYIDGSGKQRCKGGCDLKKSQHYPRGCLVFQYMFGFDRHFPVHICC